MKTHYELIVDEYKAALFHQQVVNISFRIIQACAARTIAINWCLIKPMLSVTKHNMLAPLPIHTPHKCLGASADPWRAMRVGCTQSNVSIPNGTQVMMS